MDELASVRQELKKWESAFYYTHRKKPTKEDIDNAPDDVKGQYKHYTELKKQAAAAAAPQPDGDVWGASLNKVKATPEVKAASKLKPEMSAMQKLSQKLRANSHFGADKVFSPKGCSRSKLKNDKTEDTSSDETNENIPDKIKFADWEDDSSDLKKPSIILENARKLSQNKSWSSPMKCTEKAETTNPVLYRQYSTKKKPVLNSKFLQQHAEQIDVHQEVVSNIRGDMDDGEVPIGESEESPKKKKKSRWQQSKWQARMKEDDGEGDEKLMREEWEVLKESHLKKEEELLKNSQAVLGKSNWNPLTNADSPVVKSSLPSAFEDWDDLPAFDDETIAAMEMEMDAEAANESVPSGSSSSVSKDSASVVSSNTPQSFKLDNFMKGEKLKTVNNKTPVINKDSRKSADDVSCDNEVNRHLSGKDRSRSKRKRQESEPEPSETSDVTWRSDSRCGQFPEDMNLPSDTEAANAEPPKSEPKRRKVSAAPKKIIAQNNFVRLNMKVKRFSRGGTRMKGEAYKRKAWKQKMSERSEDYGNKCFKCGEAGHWANKCPGKGKKQLPTGWAEGGDTKVDEKAFPSLKEAMQMARGIRTPKTTGARKTTARIKSSSHQAGDSDTIPDSGVMEEDEEEDDLDVVRSVYEAAPPPEGMPPLYELTEDGNLPETPAEVYDALGVFGFQSFRGGQEQAVMRILCGQSTLVVLSTGAGKSLCYQLPAYLYGKERQGTALVISPLVSLMDDQVSNLPMGLNGACLHTGMTRGQRDKVLTSLKDGNVHFLLVSPEALVGGGQQGLLPHNLPPISFACIDEAHCVSEWSHHFRPSYLRICKVLRERFGVRCMLGLTATATLTTAASVAQHLGIKNYREATIRGAPVPDNLLLSVSKDENRDTSLISLLQGERFSGCTSIIIYCTRRDQTTRISTLIRTCLKDSKPPELEEDPDEEEDSTKKKGKTKKKVTARKPKKKRGYWDAEAYHAGLSACHRRRVQTQFMAGYLRVVVATVAFGMGLDKSNVRGIIHYNLPKSFESYVQEIGRAGRDGKPAHCHVFLDQRGGDVSELKRHIFSNTVDRHVIKKLVQNVFPACRCRVIQEKHTKAIEDGGETPTSVETATGQGQPRICPGHERAIPIEPTVQALDMKEEGLSTLLCYLELHPSQWVENLTPVYATCRLLCYGGPQQMQEVAKKCPPVAVAIAREKKRGLKHGACKELQFNVVEVSDSMGWESGPVKKELKLLQWNMQTPESGPRKSGVMVEFSDLAFHLRSPGDFLDEEVDEIVNFLYNRVTTQEKTDLSQLRRFYRTLASVCHRDVWMCCDRVDTLRSNRLKGQLTDYFEYQPELEDGCVTQLTFTRESQGDEERLPEEGNGPPPESAIGDIRAFIHLYGEENSLTGRAIARVFHGIPSPCFPPEVWGRVRRFWRAHLDIDFNALRQVATKELIHMR